MPHRCPICVSICALTAISSATELLAQPCQPRWSTAFFGSGISYISPAGADMVAFSDGGRTALAISGQWYYAAGLSTPGIIAFDGESMYPLGGGITGEITAMAKGAAGFDRLYAAVRDGSMWTLASWNGQNWAHQPLGSSGPSLNAIETMLVHDDGTGPALYIGGRFTHIAGVAASGIARWQGHNWSWPLPPGSHATVGSLLAYDDGSGAALYVGGNVTLPGQPGTGVAIYRDGIWTPISGLSGGVTALAAFDDGKGRRLYAASTGQISRWNGPGVPGWEAIAAGGVVSESQFRTCPTPAGERLITSNSVVPIGRPLMGGPAQWDGEQWRPLGDGPLLTGVQPPFGPGGYAAAVAPFESSEGPLVYIAGEFRACGEIGAWNFARTDGDRWLPFGNSMSHGRGGSPFGVPASTVAAFAAHDDGQGPRLYAGGSFLFAGDRPANALAVLDGERWLGIDLPVSTLFIRSMRSWDDGAGRSLYIATAGSSSAPVYRLRQGKITGIPAPGQVQALDILDLGSGPGLYAGGSFGVLRREGDQWISVAPSPGTVYNVAVYDAGAGPQLYASATGTPSRLIRWTGASWESIPGITSGLIRALHVHIENGVSSLFIGGEFAATLPGGIQLRSVGRWTGDGAGGGAWSSVGALTSPAYAFASFDDGTGPALYAALRFRDIPAGEPRGLGRWNESSQTWESVGGDVLSHTPNGVGSTLALQPFVDGNGTRSLFIGGDFGSVADGTTSSHRIAQYIACPACYANCDGSTTSPMLNIDDFLCFIDRFSQGSALPPAQQQGHYANCDGSATAPVLNVDDFTCFINRFAQGCP